jgi:hypothetical protein
MMDEKDNNRAVMGKLQGPTGVPATLVPTHPTQCLNPHIDSSAMAMLQSVVIKPNSTSPETEHQAHLQDNHGVLCQSALRESSTLILPHRHHPAAAAPATFIDLTDRFFMPPPPAGIKPNSLFGVTDFGALSQPSPSYTPHHFHYSPFAINPMHVGNNQLSLGERGVGWLANGVVANTQFQHQVNPPVCYPYGNIPHTPLQHQVNPPHSGPLSGLKPCHFQGDSFQNNGSSPTSPPPRSM